VPFRRAWVYWYRSTRTWLGSGHFVPTLKEFVRIREAAGGSGYRESNSDLKTHSLITVLTELLTLTGNAAEVTTGIVDISCNANKCTILFIYAATFNIAPMCFGAIVRPFSGSWHQHFFKTYCNKIGHIKHTYVLVSIVQNFTCIDYVEFPSRFTVCCISTFLLEKFSFKIVICN